MQRHNKLKARILSLALSAAMVTTMMPMNVFAAESGNVVIGTSSIDASSIGTIESFDKLEDRFTPSVGENAPDYVYALSVALNTPVEDLNLPDELTAMVKRTTVTAPAEDEPVVDSGKLSTPAEDEVIPDEDKSDENVTVPGEDADIDDTVSGNQPASPSEATKEVKEEIKGEDVPLAPEPEQDEEIKDEVVTPAPEQEQDETVVTTVKQESIPVTWQSNKEYKSDENGKFIYTAVLTEDYILADGVELPQIYVMVGRQARAGGLAHNISTGNLTLTPGDGCAASTPHVVTGTTTTNYIDVSNGEHWMTLDGVNIELSGNSSPIYVHNNSTLNLTLAPNKSNILKAPDNLAGLDVYSPAKLVIDGTGSLSATGGANAPGIGSSIDLSGTITINNGTVNATGGTGGAGIGGGGLGRVGDTITITGGTVTATGGANGSGIGGGSRAGCGTISITGGTVTATCGMYGGAGIGGIYYDDNNTISITGGTVTAFGASNSDSLSIGIGCNAYDNLVGDVKISNSAKVTAYSVRPGFAIGDSDGVITPDGGTAAPIMQFDFALSTPASTTIEVKDSSGTSLDPVLSYTRSAAFQSLALTAPATGNYTVYQGTDKLKYTKDSTAKDTFAVVAGLNQYADVVGPDTTIAKAFTIGTAKPESGRSISTNASTAPTGAAATAITWTDASGNVAANGTSFAEKTVYKSTHIFTAKAGYVFDSTLAATDITVTNIGAGTKTATVSADKKTLTVVVTWPETLERPAYTGEEAPAPTLASKTETSITLTTIRMSNGEGVQYAKSTSNTAPTSDADWQGYTFNNLTKGTTYYFFARVRANTSHRAGAASAGTAITTDGAAASTTIVVGGPDATAGYETADKANLQKAIDALATGGTVKLGANIIVGNLYVVVENKVCILDLNGKTIENNDNLETNPVLKLQGTTSLTVTDSSVNKNGVVTSNGASATIVHTGTGNLTILAGTVSSTGSTPAIACTNSNGTITIEGGTILSSDLFASTIESNGKITMHGGTVTGTSINAGMGTIKISAVPTPAAIVLDIQGGTVSNTGSSVFPGGTYNSVIFPNTVTAENLSSYYSHTGGTVGTVVPTVLPDYTGTQAAAPSSTPAAKTDTTITLAAVSVGGETVEYAKSTSNTAPTSGWQDSTAFTGLTADTQYYFFARVKANTAHKAGTASTGTAIKTDKSDAQKVAAAKILADAAVNNLTATNATTAEGILSTVNTAIASVTGVTATWKSAPTITAATDSASGSITGTIVLTCGITTVEVTVNKTIAQLGSDAEKVASAKTAAVAALNSYTATNATADTDIMTLVNTAISNAGITGVTATWKVGSGFDKTNATTSATGIVTGTITLKLNSAEQDVTVNLTIAQLADKAALTAAIDAANNAKRDIIVSDSSASSVNSGVKFVTTAEMKALTDAIAAAQAIANNPASTAAQVSAAVTTLNNAVATFNAVIKTGTNSGGGGGGGGGGGSSSGGSSSTPPSGGSAGGVTTPGKTVIDNPVGNQGSKNTLAEAVKNAIATGKTNSTVFTNFANYTALTKDGLKAINDATAAAIAGKNVQLSTKVQLDNKVGNAVVSRITIDPVKLATVMPDKLGLGVWFDQKQDKQVTAVKEKFERAFDNNMVIVTFEQKDPLKVDMEFAAKPDLSKLNTKTLYFYSYNPTTNLYYRILSPNYWVDKNGYTHFTAPFGGSVVISDKPLTKK